MCFPTRKNDPALTDRIITPGRALVRAIKALGAIEPTNRLEQQLARLLLYVYKRRLRAIGEAPPAWLSNHQMPTLHC